MSTTFFIGDLHFGHKNIIKYENEFRKFTEIDEHDEELIKRWNNRVTKNDIVWVLGDFFLGQSHLHKAGLLNGSKRLVMGNHDILPTTEYLKYFTKLYGSASFDGLILTHIPVHPDQFYRYKYNIHGHLHSERIIQMDAINREEIYDPRYINVSVENINLTPIAYEEIKFK